MDEEVMKPIGIPDRIYVGHHGDGRIYMEQLCGESPSDMTSAMRVRMKTLCGKNWEELLAVDLPAATKAMDDGSGHVTELKYGT